MQEEFARCWIIIDALSSSLQHMHVTDMQVDYGNGQNIHIDLWKRLMIRAMCVEPTHQIRHDQIQITSHPVKDMTP